MMEATGNFLSDIHETDYMAAYLVNRLDASGMVNISGRRVESLNGRWNFAPDWYDTCMRAKWYLEKSRDDRGLPLPLDWDWEAWERIPVPSCWNLERAELKYFEGTGLYTRTFRYVPGADDERAFLRFEGSNYRTSVFLNGVHVGTHDGGSTPFCTEITGAVKSDNRIVVAVEARRRPDRVPTDNTDWFNYGGVYRDVYLVRTPASFVKDWFVRLSGEPSDPKIAVELSVSDSETVGKARLRIPELSVDVEVPVSSGTGSAVVSARPRLWAPGESKLYDVELSYGADKVTDRIGFRRIEVRGRDILLNGKPVFLKGICVHEDHIAKGKTTDEATIRRTIAHLRELNGNFLRLAHYPHDGRFARIADEEGVMLWAEVPVYWAIEFGNPSTYADAENQLAELVLRDRNRASVVVWSVGNENADTDARLSFMSRLAAKARALDGTRPVSAACLINHEKLAIEDRLAEHLDIIGVNEYYGWYDPDFSKLPRILANSDPDRPVVITEFGGDARTGMRGSVDDLFTEDKQRSLYEKQVEVIRACPYIKGTTPWILYDFRCPRRLNRYQEEFNRKGLIDADRTTKKPAFEVMAEFYSDLTRS